MSFDIGTVLVKTYSHLGTAFAGAVVGFDKLFDVQMLAELDSTGAGVIGFIVLTSALVLGKDYFEYLTNEF